MLTLEPSKQEVFTQCWFSIEDNGPGIGVKYVFVFAYFYLNFAYLYMIFEKACICIWYLYLMYLIKYNSFLFFSQSQSSEFINNNAIE